MLNNAEIVARASDKASNDSRQTKIASDVLKILADYNTTVSEATKILNLADNMIANSRLDFQRSLTPIPQDVPDVD